LVKKIAVVRRNGLGDLLCSIPLILHLKKLHPQAELTLFADYRNAELLPYLKCYDHSVVFPNIRYKYLSVLYTAIRYRNEKFDLAISAKPSEMKLLNLFLGGLGARQRIAVGSQKWHSKFINDPKELCTIKKHQALKCLQLIAPEMTEIPEDLYPKIYLDKDSGPLYNHAHDFVLMTSVNNNRKQSLLSLEAQAIIINEFSRHRPCHVLISCMPRDVEKAKNLSKLLTTSSSIIATPTLKELLHVIDNCNLIFIGDGGLMHLTAALDRPQVVLFGATPIEEWHPLSNKAICLYDPHNVNNITGNDILRALLQASSMTGVKP
jgi:ADP-heptose:LPS heptosyltransferase